MADQIRAAVAIQRELIEGVGVQDEVHRLVARFATAQLYRATPEVIARLRRELSRALSRRFLPYAQAIGRASAEPILERLGGQELVKRGNTLRGRVLAYQRRYHRANVMSIRAELARELKTLSGDVEAAFARAYRDGVARKQLVADLVAADKGEMAQLAKARTRLDVASKDLAKVEGDLSQLGRRAKKRRRALNKRLAAAKKEKKLAGASIRATKTFYARFETRVQAHVRDGIRREAQSAQLASFRQAGYEVFSWVAVNGTDACPSCDALHGTILNASEAKSQGPGAADTYCGSACMCQLVPEEYVKDNRSVVRPVRVGPEERLQRVEEQQRMGRVLPLQTAPKSPAFRPAKTMAEAERFAQNNLIETSFAKELGLDAKQIAQMTRESVNYSGVTVDVANAFNREFYAMRQKHGLRGLSSIKTTVEKADRLAAFSYEPSVGVGGIEINGGFIKELQAKGLSLDNWIAASHKRGFLASQNTADLAYHEATHYYAITGRVDSAKMAQALSAAKDGTVGRVSRYAAQNADEYLAEAAVKSRQSGLASFATREAAEAVKELLP